MKWNIVCDSSCDLNSVKEDNVGFQKVPFIISSGDRDFIDDGSISISEMMNCVEAEKTITHTSCPAPGSWHSKLKKGEYNIVVTISKELSGSYNSAMIAKSMFLEEHPHEHIEVINTNGTSGIAVLLVKEIVRLIEQGNDYDRVIECASDYVKREKVIFSLCSFDNLIKNGRINKITGTIASKLGFWGMGIGDSNGKIQMIGKVRGINAMIRRIVEDMEQRGMPQSCIAISHCLNASLAEKLRDVLIEKWRNIEIVISETSGLNSYYAERSGIIVGYI